ncbi:mitochondrial-processing peptidase subunit alpha [Leptopilina heterotoma]|uniref:mitochondrial-processing peptidase subunit alpha n=1 Tax=Leptopilina heterotoma TaxID=63436 RepID=UPI001CA8864C|nr:mitochondrial-processing peptidase subunit alpha [Leptopilina heterotoma]
MFVRQVQIPLNLVTRSSCCQLKYSKVGQICGFASDIRKNIEPINAIVSPFPPLSKPLPNLPTPIYSTVKKEKQETKITTLPNGLKIATEDYFGQFCTIGVLVNSGPRFEVAYPSGISHFLEKLAFNSTKNFESRDHILLAMEKHEGIFDCQASRDTFIYAASAERKGLNSITQILADIVLRPQITEDELNIARQTIEFEIESLLTRPEQEPLLLDMIHAAAYRDNTLGLPKICPEGNVNKIDRKILFTYLKSHYTPDRMVIAGVGVEHEALVEAVNKYFVDEKAIWEEDNSLIMTGRNMDLIDESVAQYTGGLVVKEGSMPVHPESSGIPRLSHVVIGLEGCSHQDPDFIAMCVLNTMMGGGGSFSAGGPGKGMYTKLYTNVLNRYQWMFSATAYNHSYADTGLFCIHASSPEVRVGEMTAVIVHELVSMAGSTTVAELERAKKQLQSLLLMNLEQRPVVFEDIGRQVLATGFRHRPEYFIDAINKITKDDINRVALRLRKSPPSVAARGLVKGLPSLSDIQAGLLDAKGAIPRSRSRLSLNI